jgi:superfamily I DNA and/or RNA helicase
MEAEPQNLYLDFGKHREYLEGRLARFKCSYGRDLLLGENGTQSILDGFVSTTFPEGLAQKYYFANTSLIGKSTNLIVRPKLEGPRLRDAFPKDVVLCVRGHLSPSSGWNPIVIIDQIVDISDSPSRDFEVEATVVPYTSEDRVYRASRSNNVLTADFLVSLPEISKQTRLQLEEWRGYLSWKKTVLESRRVGVRYLRREIRAGLIYFLIVSAKDKSLSDVQRLLATEDVAALPTACSSDAWVFSPPKDTFQLSANKSKGVGPFKGLSEKRDFQFRVDRPGAAPNWEKPLFAEACFSLSDADHADLSEAGVAAGGEAARAILEKYPPEGFLANSSIGELIQLGRQERLVKELEEQSGGAPFLTSYLFDFTKADRPKGEIRTDEWLYDNSTPDQCQAVVGILAARDVYLVQGPPGTGKTRTISEATYQLVIRGRKVLIASQANLAVDNALERLVGRTHIRAIRLGAGDKISAGGQQFSEERALASFYSTIARTCQERTLEKFEKCDFEYLQRQRWLRSGDLIHQDIEELRKRMEELEYLGKAAYDKVQMEEEALVKREEENHRIQKQTECLRQLALFLKGEPHEDFAVPDGVWDVFYKSIIGSLSELLAVHIDTVSPWDTQNDVSARQRITCAKDVLRRWRDVAGLISRVRADVVVLERLPGNGILDIETASQIEAVDARIAKAAEAMENDESQLREWQRLRKQRKELETNCAGLHAEMYRKLFTGRIDGKPYHEMITGQHLSKAEAIRLLSESLQRLERVAYHIERGTAEVLLAIDRLLGGLRPLNIDDTGLKRAQAKAHNLDISRKETAKALALKITELERTIKDVASLGKQHDWSWEDYQSLRSLVEDRTKELREEIQKRKRFRSDWEPFLREWVETLQDEQSIRSDQSLFLDTFKRNCNVVAVTCNTDRSVLERAGLAYFDVAIVDEVSKATPPELLMPMMLARKSVLVGDHRQLPPLFAERLGPWEEVLRADRETSQEPAGDHISPLTEDNFERYRKLVTASFFKDHFEKADPSLKTSLWTQFRMHPQIMDLVNFFYEGNLKCGLKDPDKERAHNLTIESPEGLEFISPNRHALWIDSSRDPCGREHFEEQRGSSKANILETILIKETLRKIDQAYLTLGYGGTCRKEIAVISFYGQQVGLLQQIIRKQQYKTIVVEVNSVDKFQGKEKAVVMVSLVRNRPKARKTLNAFVAQFERINVAFSRAQELLLIFGARTMFFDYEVRLPNLDRPGHTYRRVYQDIMSLLNRRGCLWESARVVSPDEYKTIAPAVR